MVNKRSLRRRLAAMQDRREQSLEIHKQGDDPTPDLVWEVLAVRRAV
jgi:hypothetical protein